MGASWHCHRYGSTWLVAQTGPDASGFRRMVFGRWADCQSATSRRVGTSLRYGGSAKMHPGRFVIAPAAWLGYDFRVDL